MLDRYPPRDSAGLVTKSLKILSHDILQDKWLISPCSHDANYCKHWYNKSQKHPYLITHGGMKCVCANKLRLDIAVSVYFAYPGYTTLDYGPIEILIKYTHPHLRPDFQLPWQQIREFSEETSTLFHCFWSFHTDFRFRVCLDSSSSFGLSWSGTEGGRGASVEGKGEGKGEWHIHCSIPSS